jgi:hypothetical protein
MAKNEVRIRITGDASSLGSSLKGASDEVEGFATGLKSRLGAVSVAAGALLAGGITAGLGAAAGLLTSSIGAASDMGETVSKIGVLFGDQAKAIESFAEASATQFGQSKQQAMDAAATFATFGKSAGLSGEGLTKFSTDFVGLASDLASFNNTSPEQAIEAIGAALRGETEPMRAYGVLLDDASMRQKALEMGIISTTKDALTPQQKVLAAQALIFDQTTAAQGDFERTSGGLANKQRILAAQFANVKTQIGIGLLPAVLKLVNVASNDLLPLLSKWGPILADELGPALETVIGAVRAFGAAFAAGDGDITSSGIAGTMERLGYYARLLYDSLVPVATAVIRFGQALVGAFQGKGWGDVVQRLAEAYGAAFTWLTGTAIPATARIALAIGRALGEWATTVALPFLQANIPIWLDWLGAWLEGTALPWIRVKAGQLAEVLGGWAGAAWGYLSANLPIWLDALGTWIAGTALPWLSEKVLELAVLLGGWIADAAGYLAENLPIWLGVFGDWIGGTVAPWLGEKTMDMARQMGDWIVQAAQYLADNLPGWLGTFVGWAVGEALPAIIIQTAKFAAQLGTWIGEAAVILLRNLPGWIASFTGWVATNAIPTMARVGADLAGGIYNGIWGALDFMADIGVAVVQGIINGILSMAGRLASAVGQFIADNIPGPVRSLLGIASPSKVMFDLGVWTMRGLEAGIESRSENVQQYMTQAVAAPTMYQAVQSGAQAAAALPTMGAGAGRPLTIELTLDRQVIARAVRDDIRVLERSGR